MELYLRIYKLTFKTTGIHRELMVQREGHSIKKYAAPPSKYGVTTVC